MGQSTLVAEYSWFFDAGGTPLTEEPKIDLMENDLDSARMFWAVVLMIGVRDRAGSVQFRPRVGEDGLSVTVGGIDYPMIPPSKDVRDWLLRVGCDIVAGSRWRGVLWRCKSRLLRRQSRGAVAVAYWGHCTQWNGVFGPEGLVLKRISAT
jgi:hypothetical protein